MVQLESMDTKEKRLGRTEKRGNRVEFSLNLDTEKRERRGLSRVAGAVF